MNAPRPPSHPKTKRPVLASSDAFLKFTAQVKPRVERQLRRQLSAELRKLRALGPEATLACEALSNVSLQGGKRLRAALVFAGGETFGKGSLSRDLLRIATAVEVLHSYFLVHDDWIDGDLLRRGAPSAHAQLRRVFGQSLGDSAAILAGDWGATIANRWLFDVGLPGPRMTHMLRAFAAMQLAAINGQLRDVLACDDRIEQTYQLKTASYTVEGPLMLGALASGASAQELKVISQFSRPAGVAFQLRDDLMGLFGTEEATGKPFASDLRAGKRTSVALHALANATGSDKRAIKLVFGCAKASTRQLREAVAAIERTGSREQAELRIAKLVSKACNALDAPCVGNQARQLLSSAAVALAVRHA